MADAREALLALVAAWDADGAPAFIEALKAARIALAQPQQVIATDATRRLCEALGAQPHDSPRQENKADLTPSDVSVATAHSETNVGLPNNLAVGEPSEWQEVPRVPSIDMLRRGAAVCWSVTHPLAATSSDEKKAGEIYQAMLSLAPQRPRRTISAERLREIQHGIYGIAQDHTEGAMRALCAELGWEVVE